MFINDNENQNFAIKRIKQRRVWHEGWKIIFNISEKINFIFHFDTIRNAIPFGLNKKSQKCVLKKVEIARKISEHPFNQERFKWKSSAYNAVLVVQNGWKYHDSFTLFKKEGFLDDLNLNKDMDELQEENEDYSPGDIGEINFECSSFVKSNKTAKDYFSGLEMSKWEYYEILTSAIIFVMNAICQGIITHLNMAEFVEELYSYYISSKYNNLIFQILKETDLFLLEPDDALVVLLKMNESFFFNFDFLNASLTKKQRSDLLIKRTELLIKYLNLFNLDFLTPVWYLNSLLIETCPVEISRTFRIVVHLYATFFFCCCKFEANSFIFKSSSKELSELLFIRIFLNDLFLFHYYNFDKQKKKLISSAIQEEIQNEVAWFQKKLEIVFGKDKVDIENLFFKNNLETVENIFKLYGFDEFVLIQDESKQKTTEVGKFQLLSFFVFEMFSQFGKLSISALLGYFIKIWLFPIISHNVYFNSVQRFKNEIMPRDEMVAYSPLESDTVGVRRGVPYDIYYNSGSINPRIGRVEFNVNQASSVTITTDAQVTSLNQNQIFRRNPVPNSLNINRHTQSKILFNKNVIKTPILTRSLNENVLPYRSFDPFPSAQEKIDFFTPDSYTNTVQKIRAFKKAHKGWRVNYVAGHIYNAKMNALGKVNYKRAMCIPISSDLNKLEEKKVLFSQHEDFRMRTLQEKDSQITLVTVDLKSKMMQNMSYKLQEQRHIVQTDSAYANCRADYLEEINYVKDGVNRAYEQNIIYDNADKIPSNYHYLTRFYIRGPIQNLKDLCDALPLFINSDKPKQTILSVPETIARVTQYAVNQSIIAQNSVNLLPFNTLNVKERYIREINRFLPIISDELSTYYSRLEAIASVRGDIPVIQIIPSDFKLKVTIPKLNDDNPLIENSYTVPGVQGTSDQQIQEYFKNTLLSKMNEVIQKTGNLNVGQITSLGNIANLGKSSNLKKHPTQTTTAPLVTSVANIRLNAGDLNLIPVVAPIDLLVQQAPAQVLDAQAALISDIPVAAAQISDVQAALISDIPVAVAQVHDAQADLISDIPVAAAQVSDVQAALISDIPVAVAQVHDVQAALISDIPVTVAQVPDAQANLIAGEQAVNNNNPDVNDATLWS